MTVDEAGVQGAIYFDGKKYRWEIIGSEVDQQLGDAPLRIGQLNSENGRLFLQSLTVSNRLCEPSPQYHGD